jgi:2-hydroxy-3-keto-5-methylthiopentenyl-1-phosphate phosphatase
VYKIFVDFDATVTQNDVWHVLFTKYGKPLAFEIWKEFGRGHKTAAECIRIACSTVEYAHPEEALELFQNEPLRPGFTEFVKWCEEKQLDLTVVSDGFNCYIRPILEKNGLTIPYYANDIELTESGTLSVNFPYARESCRHCGSCKCAHLLANSADDDTVVYVGDGYSDMCPVQMSDVVFARDQLLKHCEELSIHYHPFRDFFEVQRILEKYLVERPKYQRTQAHRRRKELVTIE